MLVAAEAATSSFNFTPFDIFMILFTLVIAAGVARLMKSPHRTNFSMGFSSVVLVVFLFVDALMVLNWFGALQSLQTQLFG